MFREVRMKTFTSRTDPCWFGHNKSVVHFLDDDFVKITKSSAGLDCIICLIKMIFFTFNLARIGNAKSQKKFHVLDGEK